jgi:hypothetical protein
MVPAVHSHLEALVVVVAALHARTHGCLLRSPFLATSLLTPQARLPLAPDEAFVNRITPAIALNAAD